jgi:hypothetical protein
MAGSESEPWVGQLELEYRVVEHPILSLEPLGSRLSRNLAGFDTAGTVAQLIRMAGSESEPWVGQQLEQRVEEHPMVWLEQHHRLSRSWAGFGTAGTVAPLIRMEESD